MARRSQKKEPRIIENQVDDSDDEEIDEDEAFNSEDELKYGEFFVSKKKPTAKKTRDADDDEEESYSEEDESHSSDDDYSKDWTEDSDEEDDGGQYMLDLLNNLDKQVPGKEEKKKVDKTKREGYNGKIRLDNVPAAAVHMPESEFGAAVVSVPSAANNNGSNKLTLDSLMSGISDTQGFTQMQRTMRALSSGNGGADASAKKMETTPAPVPRVVSERASRKVHYEATTEDMSQWKDIIHTQRDAETLNFRVNKGGAKASCVTKDSLIDKFEARTEFEEELARALEIAGMENEKAMEMREKKRLLDGDDGFDDDGGVDDDLGTNRISMEGKRVLSIEVHHCILCSNSLHIYSRVQKTTR
jgi:U3 small nucleolar RNA-associated protein 14